MGFGFPKPPSPNPHSTKLPHRVQQPEDPKTRAYQQSMNSCNEFTPEAMQGSHESRVLPDLHRGQEVDVGRKERGLDVTFLLFPHPATYILFSRNEVMMGCDHPDAVLPFVSLLNIKFPPASKQ